MHFKCKAIQKIVEFNFFLWFLLLVPHCRILTKYVYILVWHAKHAVQLKYGRRLMYSASVPAEQKFKAYTGPSSTMNKNIYLQKYSIRWAEKSSADNTQKKSAINRYFRAFAVVVVFTLSPLMIYWHEHRSIALYSLTYAIHTQASNTTATWYGCDTAMELSLYYIMEFINYREIRRFFYDSNEYCAASSISNWFSMWISMLVVPGYVLPNTCRHNASHNAHKLMHARRFFTVWIVAIFGIEVKLMRLFIIAGEWLESCYCSVVARTLIKHMQDELNRSWPWCDMVAINYTDDRRCTHNAHLQSCFLFAPVNSLFLCIFFSMIRAFGGSISSRHTHSWLVYKYHIYKMMNFNKLQCFFLHFDNTLRHTEPQ